MAIDEKVLKIVGEIYLAGTKGPTKILEELGKKLPELPENGSPSIRTVQRVIKRLKEHYTPEEQALDRPFNITPNFPDGVYREDLPLILEILKEISETPDMVSGLGVTVRQVRWVVVLAHAMAEAEPRHMWWMAGIYAHRERWCRIEGAMFDTQDLDRFLSYTFWRSEECRQAHIVAAERGLIPNLEQLVDAYVINLEPLNRAKTGEPDPVKLLKDEAAIHGWEEVVSVFVEEVFRLYSRRQGFWLISPGDNEHYAVGEEMVLRDQIKILRLVSSEPEAMDAIEHWIKIKQEDLEEAIKKAAGTALAEHYKNWLAWWKEQTPTVIETVNSGVSEEQPRDLEVEESEDARTTEAEI